MKIFYYFKKCWTFFIGYKHLFIINILIKLLNLIVKLISPLFFASLINLIIAKNIEKLSLLLAIILGLEIISIILFFLNARLETFIKKAINYNVKKKLFNMILLLPEHKLNNFKNGKLFSIIVTDSGLVSSYVFSVTNSLISIISILSIGIIIFSINWQLSLVLISTYPISYIINKYYSKKIRNLSKEYYEDQDVFLGFYENLLININEVKNLGAYDKINDLFSEKTLYLANLSKKREYTQNNNMLLTKLLGLLNHILNLGLGSLFVIYNKLSLGNFVAFSSYSQAFSKSLSLIVNLNATLQPSIAGLERIDELEQLFIKFELLENIKETEQLIDGDITFNNIHLILNNKEILNDLNLNLLKGKTTYIIGKNGSGKTTLANLITNKYLPSCGSIQVNQSPIENYKFKNLINNISYLIQNPNLFHITLLENLLLFNNSEIIDMKKIIEVCEKINLIDDIKQLPDGFNTQINDKIRLSTGQTQKIQIARALLQDCPIVIFDEVTSNLDSQTRIYILDTIKNDLKDKTVLFISHNKEELYISDIIYEIRDKKAFLIK